MSFEIFQNSLPSIFGGTFAIKAATARDILDHFRRRKHAHNCLCCNNFKIEI